MGGGWHGRPGKAPGEATPGRAASPEATGGPTPGRRPGSGRVGGQGNKPSLWKREKLETEQLLRKQLLSSWSLLPKGWEGKGSRNKVVVSQKRVRTLLAPSSLVLRAGPWAYFGTPSALLDPTRRMRFPREGSPPARCTELLPTIRNSVSVDKAPFSMETRGLATPLSAIPPKRVTVFAFLP